MENEEHDYCAFGMDGFEGRHGAREVKRSAST
jgi:hypothetical protein